MELKRMPEIHRINKATFIQYAILTVILFVAYLKGSRTLAYTAVFTMLDVIPFAVYAFFYKKNCESKQLKYIFTIGFSVLYAFVLITAAVPTTFVYIFLIFVSIIPYGDMKLCYITGGISVLANIVSVAVSFANGSLTTDNLAMVEIQIISIAIAALFVYLATNVTGKVNTQKLEEINEEKEKTEHILANTLNISKGISQNIDDVTEKIEQLKQSVTSTCNSMQEVTTGTNETAMNLQDQISQTEEIVAQINTAKEVTETITDNVDKTEETILVGKDNIVQLLQAVKQSEEVGSTVAEKMNELIEIQIK